MLAASGPSALTASQEQQQKQKQQQPERMPSAVAVGCWRKLDNKTIIGFEPAGDEGAARVGKLACQAANQLALINIKRAAPLLTGAFVSWPCLVLSPDERKSESSGPRPDLVSRVHNEWPPT